MLIMNEINYTPYYFRRSIASRLRETLIPTCLVVGRPHLEHCIQFWAPQFTGLHPKRDVKKLEQLPEKLLRLSEGKSICERHRVFLECFFFVVGLVGFFWRVGRLSFFSPAKSRQICDLEMSQETRNFVES